MTLTERLAARASVEPETADYLRALTLTNIAAAVGDLGRFDDLATRLPVDPRTAPGAAFVHAVHLHARTQDDFHPSGRVHVGAVALSATLALADRAGDRFLECVEAGYDAMCAVACVYSRDAQARGYRPTGIFGPFGAAAAAAAALGLDEEATTHALGLAAARSGGTNQSWLAGTDEWLLEVGYAARSGVEAALMAEAGVRAAPDAIEGAAGWARAFFDDAGATRLAAALDEPRSYVREVAQKPYPVSGIAQVATKLACDAHTDGGDFPGDVEVRMSDGEAAYPGSANTGPFRSRSDALMSVAFCVACGITDGSVRLRRLDNPRELDELASGVRVVPDSSLPEGSATLAIGNNGNRRETSGRASDILFASWNDPSLDAAPLSQRSEAREETVAAVRAALERDYPEAAEIGRLLGRTV